MVILRGKGHRATRHSILRFKKERQPSDIPPPIPPLDHDDWNLGVLEVLALIYTHIHWLPELSGPCLHVHVLRTSGFGTESRKVYFLEEIHDKVPTGKLLFLIL